METLELTSGEFSLKVTSGRFIEVDEPVIRDFVEALRGLRGAIGNYSLKLDRSGGPSSTTYTYEFDGSGRSWDQTIKFDTSPPTMNFDVQDFWAETEFAPHRQIRALCMVLVKKFEATKIEVDWD